MDTIDEHAHNYTEISANDADTDVTGAELEELTDGSETTLHSHAGGDSKILLYDQVLTGTAASINIYPTGNIPTGRSLHIRVSLRTNKNATYDGAAIELNDDTGNNYDYLYQYGYYNSGARVEGLNGGPPAILYVNSANAPSNEFEGYEIWVYDYASTAKNKNIQIRGAHKTGGSGLTYFYDSYITWHPSTPVAITKIELTLASDSFIAGSRVTAWLE